MLFRNLKGELIVINKLDYLTDNDYIDNILLNFEYSLKNNEDNIKNKIINKLKEDDIPDINNQN